MDKKTEAVEVMGLTSTDSEIMNDELQTQIEDLYRLKVSPEIFKDAEPSEEEILRKVVEITRFDDETDVPAYARYIPKYQYVEGGPGMECTLGSAMLKLALTEAGYSDVHTLLLEGHQVTGRFTEDGELIVYDPATQITGEDGIRTGFTHIFKPGEIVDIGEDEERNLKDIKVVPNEKVENTGMFESGERNFRVLPAETHVHVATVMQNLEGHFREGDPELSKEFSSLVEQMGDDNPHIEHQVESGEVPLD